MIRVLIADDHKIFRKGLKQTIDDYPDMQVTGEASNGSEVLTMVTKSHYDVIILDITMPGTSAMEILKQLKADHQSVPILFLSMHSEEQYALRVIKSGAAGYLTKDVDEEHIIEAVRKVHSGGKYITPTIAEKLAFAFEVNYENQPHEALSDREFQVMCLIAKGKSINDIARQLQLGGSTVSTYRQRILEKTGFSSNAEITRYAITNNLIE